MIFSLNISQSTLHKHKSLSILCALIFLKFILQQKQMYFVYTNGVNLLKNMNKKLFFIFEMSVEPLFKL
jgi:hypothetical protein